MNNTIKNIRTQKGMTISELSKKSKISRTTIYKVEKNEVVPSFDTIMKLSLGLQENPKKILDSMLFKNYTKGGIKWNIGSCTLNVKS